MKQLFFFLISLTLCVSSCSKEDEESASLMDNKSKRFVGYWYNSSLWDSKLDINSSCFLADENGIWYTGSNKYGEPYAGHWSYSDDTNTFSMIDEGKGKGACIWTVPTIDDISWTGVTAKGSVQAFKKMKVSQFADWLDNSWSGLVCIEGEDQMRELSSSWLGGIYSKDDSYYNPKNPVNLLISDGSGKNREVTVELKNPYNMKELKIIVKGAMSCTLVFNQDVFPQLHQ